MYDKITTKKVNVDGSEGISEATIEDNEMTFEESSTPADMGIDVDSIDFSHNDFGEVGGLPNENVSGLTAEQIEQYETLMKGLIKKGYCLFEQKLLMLACIYKSSVILDVIFGFVDRGETGYYLEVILNKADASYYFMYYEV